MAWLRLFLGLTFLASSIFYIFNPNLLIVWVNDATMHSWLFGWLFLIMQSEGSLIILFQAIVIVSELYFGVTLLIGFLIRLSGILGSIFCGSVILIQLQLINFGLILVPLFFFVLFLSLFNYNSNKYAIADKFIPESLQNWQKRK